jgi:hypothetical protein
VYSRCGGDGDRTSVRRETRQIVPTPRGNGLTGNTLVHLAGSRLIVRLYIYYCIYLGFYCNCTKILIGQVPNI